MSRADQMWAMLHPNYSADLVEESTAELRVRLFIGPPHEQTAREIEILVAVYADGREAKVFHAMELGSKFRRFREENPDG
ncbi:MAG: hypothetical protein ACOYBP_02170 [Microbacteriaceae bacterium]